MSCLAGTLFSLSTQKMKTFPHITYLTVILLFSSFFRLSLSPFGWKPIFPIFINLLFFSFSLSFFFFPFFFFCCCKWKWNNLIPYKMNLLYSVFVFISFLFLPFNAFLSFSSFLCFLKFIYFSTEREWRKSEIKKKKKSCFFYFFFSFSLC